jgi:hypothetical protein
MNAFRTIRLLAAALLALAAVAVGGVGAAQAGTFTAGQYPATITGTNVVSHTITTNLGAMECAPVFDGVLAAAGEELTLTPGYGPCTLGAKEVDVHLNGCDYVVHAGETSGEDRVAGTMDIVCPEGNAIDFEVTSMPICHLTVPPQAGLSALTYTNLTAAGDVRIDFEIVELAYGLDMGCPNPGVYANGTIAGVTTFVGFKEPGVQTFFRVD